MRLFEVVNNEPKAIPTLSDSLSINYEGMDSDELLQVLNEDMGFVLTECSQIIQEYKKAEGVLFRGLGGKKPVVCELPIRKDRKPMEMELHFADMLEAAYDTFDIAANRQNSIFTTPLIEIAESWGNTYIIFPKNGYRFSYFTTLTQGRYAFDILRGACSAALRGPQGEKITDTIEQSTAIMEVMEDLGITQTNLPGAIKNGCEVLITGSSYYAFKQQHWGSALARWLKI